MSQMTNHPSTGTGSNGSAGVVTLRDLRALARDRGFEWAINHYDGSFVLQLNAGQCIGFVDAVDAAEFILSHPRWPHG